MKKTKEIVLKAIEDLRPYLHNDGGDMELVEITKENKPLYGVEVEISFIERVITIFGFVQTYFVNSLSLGIVFIFFTLFIYFKFNF